MGGKIGRNQEESCYPVAQFRRQSDFLLGGGRSILLSYGCLYFKALTAFDRPPFHPCTIPFSLLIVNVRFRSGAGPHPTARPAIFPVSAAWIRGAICGFLLLSMRREGMMMRALIYSSSMSSVMRRCSFFFPVQMLMCGILHFVQDDTFGLKSF